jgi:hypothetical protein
MRVERRRRRRRADDGTQIVLFVIGMLVVGFLAFGAGYLVGNGNEGAAPSPSVVQNPSPTGSPSPVPTGPTASPEPEVLTDGRYFVAPTRGLEGPPTTMEFDQAYFLTGADAEQAAADHGDVLAADYYIVNDNPLLRELPVSPLVVVRYVPAGLCCDLQSGLFDPWAAAVNEELQTDYAGKDAYWWITVRSGEIVRIAQQYLP